MVRSEPTNQAEVFIMNFNAMAVFVEIVQAGSLTGATKALGMPLSTVNRKPSELEADLKVQLLEYSKKALRLTDVGALHFDHCRCGLEAFNVANRVV